jgi:hypothetical protein
MLNRLQVPSSAQVAPPVLGDLATKIRKAHSGFITSLSKAIEHAISVGADLSVAKKLTGHGRWGEFLRACEIDERTARRYMQLAALASNRSSTTDLTGLTVEGAIRKLSSPKPEEGATKTRKRSDGKAAAPQANEFKTSTISSSHLDIIAAWMAASLEERRKVVNAIGLVPLLAALPAAWWPLLKERFADRCRGSTPAVTAAPSAPASADLRIPDDPSIPTFLKPSVEEPANQREDM